MPHCLQSDKNILRLGFEKWRALGRDKDKGKICGWKVWHSAFKFGDVLRIQVPDKHTEVMVMVRDS